MSRTRFIVSLAAFLSLGVAAPALAQQPQTPAKPPRREKKVWTNEDLEALRQKTILSDFRGTAPAAAATEGAAAAGEAVEGAARPAAAAATPKEKDPAEYQKRLSPLRAELTTVENRLRELRNYKSNPNRGQAGLALGGENLNLTPENEIANLEARRREILRQIDEIEAEARRNGLSPGAVR